MSERENVPGRINIAVVGCTTTTAPFSYSKTGSTFRTVGGALSATRAGLGGVRLVDFHEDNACVITFIFQHCLQLTPAGIEYRLGHGGFNEFVTADIPHNNQCIVVHQLTAELMQVVVTAVSNLGVKVPHPVFVPGTLGNAELGFQLAVPTTNDPVAITGDGGFFAAQVNTHGTRAR